MKTRMILSIAVVGISILLTAKANSSSVKVLHNMINNTVVADTVPVKSKVIPAVKERRKKASRFPAKKAK